jgi:hypothetical protein
MSQKRTKLDIEVSRLQKNARNKLYRLRKKGAINATMAAAFNPVRPANELKNMSVIEKRQYAESLKDFNKRDTTKYQFTRGTEVVIQKEGTPILSVELWEKRIQEAELNIIREENSQRLRQIREEVLGGIPGSQVRNIDYIEFGSNVDTPIKPVMRTTDFKPGAKTAYKEVKHRLETALDDLRVATYKASIANKMKDNDADPKLVSRVKELTDNELLYLHYYTDFSALVAEYEYPDEYEKGHQAPGAQERTRIEAGIGELLQFLGK